MLFASVSCFQSLGSLVHFSCSYVVGNLQYVYYWVLCMLMLHKYVINFTSFRDMHIRVTLYLYYK